jgi:glutaredoxin-like YruB-family protein
MVTVYSTPTCPYCNKAKEYFTKHNIEFTDVNVAEDAEAADEMVRKSGQMGVPVIAVPTDGGEEVVVGFDQPRLAELLKINE